MSLIERSSRSTTIWVALMRILCTMAAQFATADLAANASEFCGHHFVPTVMKIRTTRGKQRVHYCKCGRLAVRESEGAEFVEAGAGASPIRLGACELNKL
jgi:hypothetical protein